MLTEQNFLEFRKGYIDALLWSSVNNDAADEQYFDELANGYENFGADSQERIDKDCKDFLEKALKFIPGDSFGQAGHDFALTRNEYGTDFLDREDEYGQDAAEKMNNIAASFGEVYLFYDSAHKMVEIDF
jgi:hypothetical protein